MSEPVRTKLDGTRKIIPTDKTEKTSGTGKKGKWTLYEIKATTEAGEPIELKLKSFANLKLGEVVEVAVEQEDHPDYGTSFMLSPAGKGGGLAGSVDALRERVDALEEKMEWAARRIEELGAGTPASSGPPMPGSQSQSTRRDPATPAGPGDEDIPF